MMSDVNTALVILWVVFAVVAAAGVTAVFVWAVRTRQFSDPEHAARLPLDSGIPAGDDKPRERPDDLKGKPGHVSS